jgi:hypothetical protein
MSASFMGLPVRRAVESGRWHPLPTLMDAPREFRDLVYARLQQKLADAVSVRIDNVTDYLFAGTDQEVWNDEHFPNQAPPFPHMWFETIAPKFIRSRPSDVSAHVRPHLVDGKLPTASHELGWGVLYVAAVREDLDERHRWETVMTLFRHEKTGVVGPVAERRQFVGNDGVPSDEGIMLIDPYVVDVFGQDAPEGLSAGQYTSNLVSPSFFPVRLAISFMHCKNVKVEERLPSRQVRRASERRGDPIERYVVLDIMPMREVLRTEGRSESVGLQRALHICRGHFSTYTEERPLFGKYAGRFWIPSHVRGSAEAGKVVKDYRVKVPKSAA